MMQNAPKTLGTIKTETPEQARKRVARSRQSRIEAKAVELLEHDPEVSTMSEARTKAREIDELDTQLQKGLIDPDTGRPTKLARSVERKKSTSAPSSSTPRRGPTRAPTRGTRRAVRRSARAVAAPFGSAVSTGWTLASGALGLVLLYAVLRDARVVGATVQAIGAGLSRFSDPYTPLLPSAAEVYRPEPIRRRARRDRPRARNTDRTNREATR